ncbi:MAG: hypothetical protein IPH88_08985 [Bacteroidales bacterium]|nr:hypothetical protein [Bacteroidales bacterium]
MKRSIITFYLIGFLVLHFSSLVAQPTLVLTKAGKTNHIFYKAGDRISLKAKGSGEKFSGRILILNDSIIQLNRSPKISTDSIATIYRTRHFFAQAAGSGIVVLGIYFPIGVINRAIRSERPIIDEDMLIVNGTMLGVSAISALFITRKLNIGDKWKLQVLDFGHPVYN